MHTVHHAANAIEAHLLADLLRQHGVAAFVEGEYLQGGMGELPATGLIRVVTAAGQMAQARTIIAQWESSAFSLPDDAPASGVPQAG